MTQDEIRSVILDVLQEVQRLSGHEQADLDLSDRPIGCLDGFDSLTGVEATVMIEERLGQKLQVDSVFVSEDGTRSLSLQQASARIARLLSSDGGRA